MHPTSFLRLGFFTDYVGFVGLESMIKKNIYNWNDTYPVANNIVHTCLYELLQNYILYV